MPTNITPLAGELWINLYQRDTGETCFVGNKLFQLVKRPVGMPGTLLFTSNLSPRADAGQFLISNCSFCEFGCSNDALTNDVIGVFLKASLLSSQALQLAFCRLRSAFLQSCSQVAVVLSGAIHFLARIGVAVAIGGNIDHAKVNAQDILKFGRFRRGDFASRCKKELALAINQIGFALAKLQLVKLSLTRFVTDLYPPRCGPDRDKTMLGVPVQDAIIMGNCSMQSEDSGSATVEFIGIGDFGNTTDNDLCGKSGLLSNLGVKESVEIVLPEGTTFPGDFTDLVAGLIRALKSMQERLKLVSIRKKLNDRCYLHIGDYRTNVLVGQYLENKEVATVSSVA
jgi:hypothetical protein